MGEQTDLTSIILNGTEVDTLMDTIVTRDAQRSHGMRIHPHHMQAAWKDVVSEGDQLARDASLADKSSIVCRTGQLMLASGTGAWRVRDSMNRVARILGLTVHVDLSLLSIECTCIQGHESFSEVVSLPTTGVNTHRIWLMEDYVREVEAHGSQLTVRDFHKLLDVVEHSTPDYTLWQLGLAAGSACGAFVFLLGGGPVEMLCAFVGAGLGNLVRASMLRRRLGQFSCIACGVAVACVCYLLALLGLSRLDPTALAHEAGYIGAMLFVIPGFPLITAGLDIAKLDMRSGIERLVYAMAVIVLATLMGWLVAEVVGLSPDDFQPLGLGPAALTLLRVAMSFVGVFSFSVMFNSPVQMAATAGVIGAVSNTLRLTLADLPSLLPGLGLAAGCPPEAAAFLGAIISGLLAHLAERWTSYPRISLTVPSIVIMVPGLYLYRAMYYMCVFDTASMLSWFVRAVLIVAFLPVGLGIARTLTDPRWRKTS